MRYGRLLDDEAKAQHAAKAAEIWQAMNASERHGVRFGLFPADKMEAAERGGYNAHALAVALMDLAKTA